MSVVGFHAAARVLDSGDVAYVSALQPLGAIIADEQMRSPGNKVVSAAGSSVRSFAAREHQRQAGERFVRDVGSRFAAGAAVADNRRSGRTRRTCRGCITSQWKVQTAGAPRPSDCWMDSITAPPYDCPPSPPAAGRWQKQWHLDQPQTPWTRCRPARSAYWRVQRGSARCRQRGFAGSPHRSSG